MVRPQVKKIIRELLWNKTRTVLIVLAIAVGIAAFGSVFVTNDILLNNMELEYRTSRPAAIQLYVSEFDRSLVSTISRQNNVKDVSAQAFQTTKYILPDGKEISLTVSSVPDYSEDRLNRLVPQRGSWPPKKGELFLERESLVASKRSIGDTVPVKGNGDRVYQLVLAGTAYDNASIPYAFTGQMTGFISWDTLAYLGYPKRYNRLDIAVSSDVATLPQAEKLTFDLQEFLADRGITVNRTRVDKPNQHWAVDNSRAFTAILSAMGIFSLVLSGFLVINTVTGLLTQQTKQIGIMKAIGGTRHQLFAIYLAIVSCYGILALLVALPVGTALAYVFSRMVLGFLNLDMFTFYLPLPVFLMQVAAALIVPVVSSAVPIAQVLRSSIHEAIADTHSGRTERRFVEDMFSPLGGISRGLVISLRNTFRKKGRLVLTLSTLVMAGAMFISVINSRSSMFREMDRILSMFDYEVSLLTDKNYDAQSILARLKGIPSVTQVEARTGVSARRIKPDGTKGDAFGLSGLPWDTVFSQPVMVRGRWLSTSDTFQIVLASGLARDNPDLGVGDDLAVSIDNDTYHFEIIGINAMSGDQKLGFVNFATISSITDKPGQASTFLIKTSPADAATQDAVAKGAEDLLKRSGVRVVRSQTRNQIFSSAAGQFDFMVFFLLTMAIMVAVVGGLGLAGTMSLNVMERTREIGIMRSIGASNSAIYKIVMTEGVIVGIVSWLFAFPLSIPMTYGLAFVIGNAFFERTLVFAMVPFGVMVWLMLVIFVAVAASAIPSRQAVRMSIRDTIAYE